VSHPAQKPLRIDEIEALLRAARERPPSVRSDVVSSEPLGPGDVQHLQNTAFMEAAFPELADSNGLDEFSWPGNALSADERLRQAEQQLADVLSTRDDSLDAPSVGMNSVGMNSVSPPFQFAPFDSITDSTASAAPTSSGLSLESLGDIELDVTLELGRAEVTIEELLQLRAGSVVSLDKAAGEPIDILANGRLVARGEVIVVEGKFGVRLCEVIAQR